jgi:hypothetical protein
LAGISRRPRPHHADGHRLAGTATVAAGFILAVSTGAL